MPELPDLAILADAIDAALAGRPLTAATTPQPLVVRGTPAELGALEGQALVEVTRRGKFLVLSFERDQVVVNPMLTGRLGLDRPGTRPLSQTAVVLSFSARRPGPAAVAGRMRAAADWVAGADWLPASADDVELRYRDPTRMGKLYLLPAGTNRPVAGWHEQGPDADAPELTLEEWRRRIRRHTGELKNLLRNQAFVAGVGNAYSDEILWAARLAPFRARSTLAPDEVDELYRAMRSVLEWAVVELRRLVPPRLEVEQRQFLRVHRKGGQSCPRCATRLAEVSPGGFVTTWCRSCQR